MPVKFSIDSSRGENFRFDPDELIFSDFTGRKYGASEAAIQKMVDSILVDGQLQDIGVRKNFEGQAVVIFGHTRVLAIRRINELKLVTPKMLVRAVYFNCNEEEAAIMTLRENDDDTRTAITPIDLAFFIRQLETRYGYSDKDIAEKMQKKPSEISNLRKLLELDTPTQKRIASGEINLHTALALVKVAPEDRGAVLSLAAEVPSKNGKTKITASKVAATARATNATVKGPIRRTVAELRLVLKYLADQKKPKRAAHAVTAGLVAFLDGQGTDSDLIEIITNL